MSLINNYTFICMNMFISYSTYNRIVLNSVSIICIYYKTFHHQKAIGIMFQSSCTCLAYRIVTLYIQMCLFQTLAICLEAHQLQFFQRLHSLEFKSAQFSILSNGGVMVNATIIVCSLLDIISQFFSYMLLVLSSWSSIRWLSDN